MSLQQPAHRGIDLNQQVSIGVVKRRQAAAMIGQQRLQSADGFFFREMASLNAGKFGTGGGRIVHEDRLRRYGLHRQTQKQ